MQYIGDSVRFLEEMFGNLRTLLDLQRQLLAGPPAGVLSATQRQRLHEAEAAADLEFLAAETPRAFERTLDGVTRIAGIVRAMKEFAHPDVADQALADVNHAIDTTLTVCRSEYRYCATVVTHWGELPEILCIIGELNQVFLNLIVNAAHAIEQSGLDSNTGRIDISTSLEDGWVRIEFGDNGCGIPPENLEKIFDPFFTTKDVGRGTGQGLAITRAIVVDKHRGRIEVDSTVGVGTRFTLRLPVGGRESVRPS